MEGEPSAGTGVGAGRRALVVLCGAQLLLATDATIVTVANPSIQRAFHVPDSTLQWTLTAYAITFGGFLLVGGRLADLFGQRRMFLVGIVGFTAASMAAGTALSMTALVVFRAAQGLCAALVSPATLALINTRFEEGRPQQRALGVWATAGSVGGLIGFVLGGALTGALGWRWIFFVNGPVGVLTVLAAWRWLPPVAERHARRKVDVAGAASVTAALVLVVFALGQAQERGWSSPAWVVPAAVAVLLLGAFGAIESRVTDPLLPLAMLRRRAAIANLNSAIQQAVSASTLFLSALYMQQVFGYSPAKAGLATLPLPIGFALGANLSSRLMPRVGSRRLITGWCLVLAVALTRLALLPDQGAYAETMLPAIGLFGLGLGGARVPTVVAATAGAGPAEKGIVAGFYNMCQQLGGAVGLAALATVAATGAATLAGGGSEAHGLRLAFSVSTGLCLLAAGLAAATIRVGSTAAAAPVAEQPRAPGLEPAPPTPTMP